MACTHHQRINLDAVINPSQKLPGSYLGTYTHKDSPNSCDFCLLLNRLVKEYNRPPYQLNLYLCRSRTRGHELPISQIELANLIPAWDPHQMLRKTGLSVFCSPEDPVKMLINTMSLGYAVDSLLCMSIAQKWLAECSNQAGNGHTYCRKIECSKALLPRLPDRVINVGCSDGSQVPFLQITSDDIANENSRGNWVALSHCWGGAVPLQTTMGTLESRQHGIPMSTLPASFRDAVITTRTLGFQYLWIDSLCIIQDSPEDWSLQSGLMNRIYSNAALVIAAEAAPNSDAGIFDSMTCGRSQDLALIDYTYPSQSLAGSLWFRRTEIKRQSKTWLASEGPLSRRAWTLQENFLAPRVLRYGTSQLQWSCRSYQAIEEDPHRRFPPDTAKDLFTLAVHGGQSEYDMSNTRYQIFRSWYRAVNEFCKRDISIDHDRLPAIAGLAKEMYSRLPSIQPDKAYHAGLWSQNFHLGLTWSARGVSKRNSTEVLGVSVPSWSWASIHFDDLVDVYDLSLEEHPDKLGKTYARIAKVETTNATSDQFLRTLSGQLVIKGLVGEFDALLHYSPPTFFQKGWVRNKDLMYSSTFCIMDEIHQGLWKSHDLENRGITYVQIGTFKRNPLEIDLDDVERGNKHVLVALMLEPVHTGTGEYKRIGIAEISHVDSMFMGWDHKEVTII